MESVSSPAVRRRSQAEFSVNNTLLPEHLSLNTGKNIVILLKAPPGEAAPLTSIGYQAYGNYLLLRCSGTWAPAWQATEEGCARMAADWDLQIRAAVFSEERLPPASEVEPHLRPAQSIRDILSSLWLGEALLDNRVVCYLQPIIDRHGALFGHEAFARAHLADGRIASGYDIITASRHLNIEYRLDRQLQRKAIEALVQSGQPGRLFINFLPGFIHRPEIYLNGLCEEVRESGIDAGRIVLDLTQAETQKNMEHLKAIARFCHEQGFAFALDDIRLTDHSEKLLQTIRPNFVKLDQRLQAGLMSDRLVKLVTMARILGIRVIGEGVESEEQLAELKAMGVDYFQGYHIGLPAPIAIPTQAANL